MRVAFVKKEGYMFSAEDGSAELLHEVLGYRLYSIYQHVRTGFPIVGYHTVKKRLYAQGVKLQVEDMSEEEINEYIVDHGYTVKEDSDKNVFVLNCLLEGIDPTNGVEVERDSFLYDPMVQQALVVAREAIAKQSGKRIKTEKLGGHEPTIPFQGLNVIVDENGEISTDITLFHRLREWRLEKMIRGKIAGYVIFHDKTLVAIATYLPKTREEFLSIHGVGENKWNKYGEEIIEIIQDHIKAKDSNIVVPF